MYFFGLQDLKFILFSIYFLLLTVFLNSQRRRVWRGIPVISLVLLKGASKQTLNDPFWYSRLLNVITFIAICRISLEYVRLDISVFNEILSHKSQECTINPQWKETYEKRYSNSIDQFNVEENTTTRPKLGGKAN